MNNWSNWNEQRTRCDIQKAWKTMNNATEKMWHCSRCFQWPLVTAENTVVHKISRTVWSTLHRCKFRESHVEANSARPVKAACANCCPVGKNETHVLYKGIWIRRRINACIVVFRSPYMFHWLVASFFRCFFTRLSDFWNHKTKPFIRGEIKLQALVHGARYVRGWNNRCVQIL